MNRAAIGIAALGILWFLLAAEGARAAPPVDGDTSPTEADACPLVRVLLSPEIVSATIGRIKRSTGGETGRTSSSQREIDS
jgi:hypothetical protein